MQAEHSKLENPILAVACIAIACIAVILFCTAAVAAIMAWIPAFDGGGSAPQTAAAPAMVAQASIQAPAQPQAPTLQHGPAARD